MLRMAKQNPFWSALPVSCLSVVLLAGGCVMERAGTAVMKLEPGTAPEMGTAKVDGYYGLYVGKSGGRAMARNKLKAGDPLGFATTAKDADGKALTGKLFAVAGNFAVPVDPTETFEWREVPETETRDYLQMP
jgi:hypothetical protein